MWAPLHTNKMDINSPKSSKRNFILNDNALSINYCMKKSNNTSNKVGKYTKIVIEIRLFESQIGTNEVGKLK